MHRTQLIAPAASLIAVLVSGPILGAIALAHDPHVVKPGDTLTGISKRHGVSVETIASVNGIADPNRIYIGQRLVLSVPASPAPATPATAAPATTAPASVIHTVRSGENLTRIARRYGVTITAIVSANAIANPSRIFAGQPLTIPSVGAPPASTSATPVAAAATRVHVVGRGENLTRIARRYGVSVASIVSANGIADPSRIFAGQRLVIPGTSAAAVPAAPAAPAMPPSMAKLVAQRDSIRQLIVAEASRQGVPPALALAVAWQESGWQQGVVSHAGAIGIMQLMPATAAWVGEAMLGSPVNPHDATQNVRAGVRLLAHYLARYNGDRARVLAAYYQGQWATDHHGIYAVSRPYIASVASLERLFGG